MSKLRDHAWKLTFWKDLGTMLQVRLDDGFCPGQLPLKPEGNLILSRLKHYRMADAGKPEEQPLIDLIRSHPDDAPRFLHPVAVGLLKGEAPAGQDIPANGHPPYAGVLLMHGGSGWGGIPNVHPREWEAIWRLAVGFSHDGGYGSMTLERWTTNDDIMRCVAYFKVHHGLLIDLRRFGNESEYINPTYRRSNRDDEPITWDL
jgi:hypothetical protein